MASHATQRLSWAAKSIESRKGRVVGGTEACQVPTSVIKMVLSSGPPSTSAHGPGRMHGARRDSDSSQLLGFRIVTNRLAFRAEFQFWHRQGEIDKTTPQEQLARSRYPRPVASVQPLLPAAVEGRRALRAALPSRINSPNGTELLRS